MDCAICDAPCPHNYHCDQAHPGLCHFCGSTSFVGAHGYYDHADPEAHAPQTVVLSPRDVQALTRYRIHREAVLGTGGSVGREDEA